MKLPKNFGGLGGGTGNLMEQVKLAQEKAGKLEDELAEERVEVKKNGVMATFDGRGMLVKIEIDKALVDPDEKELMEDLIVSAARDGFEQATVIRNERVAEIQKLMPQIPGF